ncbi:MAG: DUF2183 domain-containing protein [Myxococcaceae bacterium]|nr:DUF2183 domain-containing protein [Myxococcaceae bacterium]
MGFSTLAVAVPLLALGASPQMILWPAVGTPDAVVLSGRVLAASPSPGSSTLSRNLRRLTAPPLKGVSVEVRLEGASATAVSDADGAFEVSLHPAKGGFSTGLLRAEAKVPGAPAAAAGVQVLAAAAPYFVVSDFDDTLAITNVRSKRGLLKAALLQDEATQPAVPGMSGFYRCLARASSEAPPAFALVSGSPIQYASRVASFLSRNRFPSFGLYLRELGPSTLHDYKQPMIRALLGQLTQPVVLVGDSGEHDPEVYRQMAAEFPGRVKAIYIRDAGGDVSAERLGPAMLFHDPAEALADAIAKGLAPKDCALEREGGE